MVRDQDRGSETRDVGSVEDLVTGQPVRATTTRRRRWRFWPIMGWSLVALVVVVLGVGFWYANSLTTQMVQVRIPPSQAVPADFGLTAEDVEFRTADGLRISAWFIPAQDSPAQSIATQSTLVQSTPAQSALTPSSRAQGSPAASTATAASTASAASDRSMGLTASAGSAGPAELAGSAGGQAAKGTVILVHGWGGDLGTKGNLLGHAQFLVNHGYNALPIDLRAHGDSEGHKITQGWDEAKDVVAAVQYLRDRPGTAGGKIALMGFSMGASTVLLAAPQIQPPVNAIIANSGYASVKEQGQNMLRSLGIPVWLAYPLADVAMRIQMGVWMEQVSPERAATQLGSTPLFVIHGTADDQVTVDQAQKLFDRASGPKELWNVPGAPHCIIDDPNVVAGVQNGEYERRILAFLDRYMG